MSAMCGDLFEAHRQTQQRAEIFNLTRRVETPAARNSDPITSHLAADAITASGMRFSQQKQVADAVHRHPGHTSQELAELTGLDRYMLARRLPECETGGTVRRGEPKHCTVTNRLTLTWWQA